MMILVYIAIAITLIGIGFWIGLITGQKIPPGPDDLY